MQLKIGEMIKNRGYTNKQIADILDVDQNTISRYITGRIKITLETAIKLAEILNCKVDDLYDR